MYWKPVDLLFNYLYVLSFHFKAFSLITNFFFSFISQANNAEPLTNGFTDNDVDKVTNAISDGLNFEEDEDDAYNSKDLPPHACRWVLMIMCTTLPHNNSMLTFLCNISGIVEYMNLHVWCSVTPQKNGFATAEAIHLAGNCTRSRFTNV